MRPVPGYEGRYSVTSDGQVYSHLYRRMIGGYLNNTGYLCVVLTRNYERLFVGVHRLVALAWVPNPDGKPEVNHLNGVRSDNRAENLEWVTHLENCSADRALHLMATRARGVKNGGNKYPPEKVQEVRRLCASGVTQKEAAKRVGMSNAQAHRIVRGQSWKCLPHVR